MQRIFSIVVLLTALFCINTAQAASSFKSLSKFLGKILGNAQDMADETAGSAANGATRQTPEIPFEVSQNIADMFHGSYGGFNEVAIKNPELKKEFSVLKNSVSTYEQNIALITGGKVTEEEERTLFRLSQMRGLTAAKARFFMDYVRIKPLEDIYGKSYFDRPLDEVMEVAHRTDRVLVAVLDSGIDYNHPFLAYKIPRSDQELISKIGHDKYIKSLKIYKHRNLIGQEIKALKASGDVNPQDILRLDRELKEAKSIVHRTSIGWDFFLEDHLPYDSVDFYLTHGTHVAGIIVKDTDDVALLPIRRNMLGGTDWDEISYAAAKDARIVNFSVGSRAIVAPSDVMINDKALFQSAKEQYEAMKKHKDILFVVAAGNEGRNIDEHPVFPATYDLPNVLTVAHVDANNKLYGLSNYGKNSVDIAALGDDIVSASSAIPLGLEAANPGGYGAGKANNYISTGGTSFATPQVTRVAAKILHINPNLKPPQVIDILKRSVTKVEDLKDKIKFGGVLNEERALQLAREGR